MKRFILSVLCVSVFFIGVGSIIEKTSAKFTSDDKAVEIINRARIAIGGGQNLGEVKSLTIVGTTTHIFESEGIQDVKQGNVEINMQMPGQYSKMVKIGNPGDGTSDAEIRKDVQVIVQNPNGGAVDFMSEGGNKKGVFVIKKDDGENPVWNDSDSKVKIDGDKIIITKADGTTEEIKIDGSKRINLTKDAGGNIVTKDIQDLDGENTFVFKSDDGKVITEDIENTNGNKVIIMKDKDGNTLSENLIGPHKIKFARNGGSNQNEMLRMTIALLMKTPEGMNVNYKFAGEGNIDGNPSNIIDVTSNGSTFKLYIDASSNLPQMISYQSNQGVFFFKKDGTKEVSKEEILEMNKKRTEPSETQIKFADFRSVGNIILPHRWTESVNGKQTQTTNITNYELNPANIADKFGKGGVFVRRMKK